MGRRKVTIAELHGKKKKMRKNYHDDCLWLPYDPPSPSGGHWHRSIGRFIGNGYAVIRLHSAAHHGRNDPYCKEVSRAVKNCFTISDMPFVPYQVNAEQGKKIGDEILARGGAVVFIQVNVWRDGMKVTRKRR